MHANTCLHQLRKMYSAKSYHKESIQNSGNGIREGKEKSYRKCLRQSRGITEQHLHFHVSLCIKFFLCANQYIFQHLHI